MILVCPAGLKSRLAALEVRSEVGHSRVLAVAEGFLDQGREPPPPPPPPPAPYHGPSSTTADPRIPPRTPHFIHEMIAAHRIALATARCTRTSIAAPAFRRTNLVCLPVRRLHQTTLLKSDEIPRTAQGIPNELKKEYEESAAVEAPVPETAATATESTSTTPESTTPETSAESEASKPEAQTSAEPEASKPEAEELVPWFLRMRGLPKPPKHTESTPAVLEIPADAPAEIEAATTQLSEELGITDLSILDLRGLDPPPAIGMDTIMIVGTARSVKHLHAVADKMCRWMRSEYKWTPYADGLLGRNELRLINKRKRRRGKVVSSQLGEVEEAGSSAWVCVHAGQKGIIIQLFTASKRQEVNIEGLWNGTLRRSKRAMEREELARQELLEGHAAPSLKETEASLNRFEEEEAALGLEEAAEEEQAKRAAEQEKELMKESSAERAPHSPMPSVSGPVVQTRAFHNTRITRGTDESNSFSSYSEASAHETPKIPTEIPASIPRILKGPHKTAEDAAEYLASIDPGRARLDRDVSPVPAKYTCEHVLKHLTFCLPYQFIPPISKDGVGIIGKSFDRALFEPFGFFPESSETSQRVKINAKETAEVWNREFCEDLANHPRELQQKYMVQYLCLSNTLNPTGFPDQLLWDFMAAQKATLGLEHYYLIMLHFATQRPHDRAEAKATFDARLKTLETILAAMRESLGDESVDMFASSPEYSHILSSMILPSYVFHIRQTIITQNLNTERRKRLTARLAQILHIEHRATQEAIRDWLILTDPFEKAKYGVWSYSIKEHHFDRLTWSAVRGAWHEFWDHWFALPTHNIDRDVSYYRLAVGLVLTCGTNAAIMKAARLITPEIMARESSTVSLSADYNLTKNLLRVLLRAKDIEGTVEFDERISLATEYVDMLMRSPQRRNETHSVLRRSGYLHQPNPPTIAGMPLLSDLELYNRNRLDKERGLYVFHPYRPREDTPKVWDEQLSKVYRKAQKTGDTKIAFYRDLRHAVWKRHAAIERIGVEAVIAAGMEPFATRPLISGEETAEMETLTARPPTSRVETAGTEPLPTRPMITRVKTTRPVDEAGEPIAKPRETTTKRLSTILSDMSAIRQEQALAKIASLEAIGIENRQAACEILESVLQRNKHGLAVLKTPSELEIAAREEREKKVMKMFTGLRVAGKAALSRAREDWRAGRKESVPEKEFLRRWYEMKLKGMAKMDEARRTDFVGRLEEADKAERAE